MFNQRPSTLDWRDASSLGEPNTYWSPTFLSPTFPSATFPSPQDVIKALDDVWRDYYIACERPQHQPQYQPQPQPQRQPLHQPQQQPQHQPQQQPQQEPQQQAQQQPQQQLPHQPPQEPQQEPQQQPQQPEFVKPRRLTDEEKLRHKRERNRRAAANCRRRKDEKLKSLQDENTELRKTIENLQAALEKLQNQLRNLDIKVE